MLSLICAVLLAQQFEVASVKPSGLLESEGQSSKWGGGVRLINCSLSEIIRIAYGLQLESLIVGGPGWLRFERWTIIAKSSETLEETPEVRNRDLSRLRNLLKERFGLVARVETRKRSYFNLVQSPRGHRMQPSTFAEGEEEYQPGGDPSIHFKGGTTEGLADMLSRHLRKAVVDSTMIKGKFDFKIAWKEELTPGAEGQTLFDVLDNQLGLRLQDKIGPVNVVAITRVKRASGD